MHTGQFLFFRSTGLWNFISIGVHKNSSRCGYLFSQPFQYLISLSASPLPNLRLISFLHSYQYKRSYNFASRSIGFLDEISDWDIYQIQILINSRPKINFSKCRQPRCYSLFFAISLLPSHAGRTMWNIILWIKKKSWHAFCLIIWHENYSKVLK